MVSASLRTMAGLSGRTRANRVESCVFWLAASLLAIVLITFSTAVYRSYSLPRFGVLLIGSSVLVALLLLIAAIAPGDLVILKSRYVVMVSLYLLAEVSSILGIKP
jgi:hypothetical protein